MTCRLEGVSSLKMAFFRDEWAARNSFLLFSCKIMIFAGLMTRHERKSIFNIGRSISDVWMQQGG